MGTNYYLKPTPCLTCGHVRHIGKSSMGWKFLFRGYRRDIESYQDWLREFSSSQNKNIYDEYGSRISLDDFKEMVESKKDGMSREAYPDDSWIDEDGNEFTEVEFC